MLRPFDEFPGWTRAPAVVEALVAEHGARVVADIGGGANPLLPQELVTQRGLDYHVLDISPVELAKAPKWCRKITVDVAAPDPEFRARVGDLQVDLAFSHMLLEHVRDARQAHRNVGSILRPGGIAVHFYPTPCVLPLAVNRLVPERISTALARLAQPERDFSGHEVKFPALYRACGIPGPRMTRMFDALGFDVVRHVGYVGHDYYRRFPLLRDAERAARRLLTRAGVPATCAALVVLRRR
jgi:SAM-dependent methyltransferase